MLWAIRIVGVVTSVPGQRRFFAVNLERSRSRLQQITAPFWKTKKKHNPSG